MIKYILKRLLQMIPVMTGFIPSKFIFLRK